MKNIFYYFIQKLVDSKFFLLHLSNRKLVGWVPKYSKAAPFLFKKKLFDENDISDGIGVETGTYLGLSTEYLEIVDFFNGRNPLRQMVVKNIYNKYTDLFLEIFDDTLDIYVEQRVGF